MRTDATRAVSVLAELAPSGAVGNAARQDVTDRVLLPLDVLRFLRSPISSGESAPFPTGRRRDDVVDMIKRARLHGEEADLRLGWLWLAVPTKGGTPKHYPLLSARVEATAGGGDGLFTSSLFSNASLARTGDIELTELIIDDADRQRLEATAQFGGGSMTGHADDTIPPGLLPRLRKLMDWAGSAATAAGFPNARIVVVEPSKPDQPVVVAQAALYLREPPRASVSIKQSLYEWAKAGIDATAFAALYEVESPPEDEPEHGEVTSSIVLSRSQEAVVRSARAARTTVVSGPPGSGKTQTVVAAALDVVERGGSVLIAAPSPASVEALITLLTDTPGPDPVVFGDTARRIEVADRLGQGGGELLDRRAVAAARSAWEQADAEFREQYAGITDVLRAELVIGATDPIRTFRARQVAPSWFVTGADLETAAALLERATAPHRWFAEFRRNRAVAKLRTHAGVTTGDLEQLERTLAIARSERIAEELTATGGIDLDRSWQQLARLAEQRRDRLGRLRFAEAHAADRVDRRARATMGAVAAALRSGRARRRRRLATIDGASMMEALPLWVGTLRDVDDLLPRSAGMFDLVIVDEASQVDQVQAAPALLRARRSMIVGDPRQLRHVSFLADDRIAEVIEKKRATTPDLAHRLDVRRMSLFDLGAASARTRMLDEHFRSTPHLIEFSSQRFYDGRLRVATRHPSNHAHDHIHVRTVDGRRSDAGVNDVEIEEALTIVERIAGRARAGEAVGSVGILTPSRAQADQIEEVVLERFDLGVIEALRLRVGTVHGFQGCERDLTVISLALDDSSSAGSRAFVANPHLFNVMVTRARQRVEIVSSLTADDGLIGDYLGYADAAPAEPLGAPHDDPTVAGVADDLRRARMTAVTNYPAGTNVIDLVVGTGRDAIAVNFGVHTDGPDAHAERELALRHLGWRTMGVFASRWADRDAELALELARLARPQPAEHPTAQPADHPTEQG